MSVRLLLALGFGATACATVAASQTAASRVAIPLCAGLTLVTAIDDPRGDYESVKRITKVTAEAVELTVNGDRPLPTGVRKIRVARTVRRTDLADATFYLHYFDPRAPSEVPGSTALGTSSAVLSKLRATGAAELAVVDPGFAAAPAAEMMNHLFRYRLTRLNVGVVPVTVNGAKVDLPAIVADARTLGDRAQFAFLDDDRHPITLRYAFNNGAPGDETGRLQVVRISYDCSETPSATPSAPAPIGRLESALRDLGRADVYEIYFEFNSDRIREESEPTLREIAEVMRRHADWAIGIEGHTDSIAGDAYNLDLSTRRAAAVREALAARHGVAASRLTTAGFGESRPKDRNDTLEGRARNRRVELVRRP